jgi:hypothetical protein
MTDNCIVCELPDQPSANAGARDVVRYQCARCGQFDINGTAMAVISSIAQRDRPLISDWIGEHNRFGERPLIRDTDFPRILTRRRIGWRERADRLLVALVRATDRPGAQLDVRDPQFSGTLQAYDSQTAIFLAKLLIDESLVSAPAGDPQLLTVTAIGFIRADELGAKSTASAQGFVAMWFSPETNDAWQGGFHPGVVAAGYDPLRVDMVEHANKICDEIVAEIRRSRFVVADFTGQRGGVYFEAGFALGLGLPVIWTCRADEVERLHFDIRQYNCIGWTSPEELLARLSVRIQALIGRGPRLP